MSKDVWPLVLQPGWRLTTTDDAPADDDSLPLSELQAEATRELERLRRQQAEIEAALAGTRNKPPTDRSSRKYLRLWKAVHAAKYGIR